MNSNDEVQQRTETHAHSVTFTEARHVVLGEAKKNTQCLSIKNENDWEHLNAHALSLSLDSFEK